MKKKENFLDYIPRPNKLYETGANASGHIEIRLEHKGIADRIAQKVFHKPKVSRIELDDFGSFVWREMNGEKSIYEIGQAVHRRFGAKAEPLYERLSKFMKILHDNHFIVYVNKLQEKR